MTKETRTLTHKTLTCRDTHAYNFNKERQSSAYGDTGTKWWCYYCRVHIASVKTERASRTCFPTACGCTAIFDWASRVEIQASIRNCNTDFTTLSTAFTTQ